MTSIKYLIAACVLALGVGSAKANVVEVFSLDGTAELFDIGAGIPPGLTTPFNAQMTLNTNTGLILDFSAFAFQDPLPATEFFQSGSTFGFIRVESDLLFSRLEIHAEDSLIGYAGGTFTGDFLLRHAITAEIVGTISPVSSPKPPSEVPLPAAFPLFLMALASLVILGIRRIRS